MRSRLRILLPVCLAALAGADAAAERGGRGGEQRGAFAGFDPDGDGRVELDEVPATARPFLASADENGDGILTPDELQLFRDDPGGARKVPLPDGVLLRADLPYAGTGNPRQRLDLLLPREPALAGPLPLVVYVHGGAWNMGSRLMGRPELAELVATGRYVGASLGYRLSPEAPWPAQIHDLKAALRWLRAHAERYGIDPGRVAAMGASAGGHLVAVLGTTGDAPELEGALGAHPGRGTRVQCVVDSFGATDLTRPAPASRLAVLGDGPSSREQLLGGPPQERPERARQASPLLWVSPDDPPFLLIHGTRDALVPIAESERLAAALRGAGVEARLQVVEGGGHGDFAGPPLRRRVALFLARCLHGEDVELETAPLRHPADTAAAPPAH